MQESAFNRMCKVFVSGIGLALASFMYSLLICGACTAGYFMALGMALLVFTMTILGGIVLYLE